MNEKEVHDTIYLQQVKEELGIKQVYAHTWYYRSPPLEEAFGLENIIYAHDMEPLDDNLNVERDYPYILADTSNPPFKNDIFEAFFYQHNHAGTHELQEMLKTVKDGGIVIFSTLDCEDDVPLSQMHKQENLVEVKLPFESPENTEYDDRYLGDQTIVPVYTVFQKIPIKTAA